MSYFATSLRKTDTRKYNNTYNNNFTPITNIGAAIAKNLTQVNEPYRFIGDPYGLYTVEFKFNFIKQLRRMLSGDTGDRRFSLRENQFYDRYTVWTETTELLEISEITEDTIYSFATNFQNHITIKADIVFDTDVIFYKGYTLENPYSITTLNGHTVTIVDEDHEITKEMRCFNALETWLVNEVQNIDNKLMIRGYSNQIRWN